MNTNGFEGILQSRLSYLVELVCQFVRNYGLAFYLKTKARSAALTISLFNFKNLL